MCVFVFPLGDGVVGPDSCKRCQNGEKHQNTQGTPLHLSPLIQVKSMLSLTCITSPLLSSTRQLHLCDLLLNGCLCCFNYSVFSNLVLVLFFYCEFGFSVQQMNLLYVCLILLLRFCTFIYIFLLSYVRC